MNVGGDDRIDNIWRVAVARSGTGWQRCIRRVSAFCACVSAMRPRRVPARCLFVALVCTLFSFPEGPGAYSNAASHEFCSPYACMSCDLAMLVLAYGMGGHGFRLVL